jgi:hypothetical protein
MDAVAFFDGLVGALNAVARADWIAGERAHIATVTKPECGNCEHWMKTCDCPLEKRGEKPSMSHWPCDVFQLSRLSVRTQEKMTAELEAKIAAK